MASELKTGDAVRFLDGLCMRGKTLRPAGSVGVVIQYPCPEWDRTFGLPVGSVVRVQNPDGETGPGLVELSETKYLEKL